MSLIHVRRRSILAEARVRGGFGALSRVGADPAIALPAKDLAIALMTTREPTGPEPATTKDEKFADPHYYDCSGGVGYVVAEGSEWNQARPLGYEYLASVPRDSASRVAAMRGKVVRDGATASTSVRPFEVASQDAMRRLAIDLYQKYSDEERWPELAKSLGVPISQIASDYERVTKAIGAYAPGSSQFLTEMWRSLGDKIMIRLREVAGAVGGLAGGASSGSSEYVTMLGEASQVIGPFVKIVIDAATAETERQRAEFGAACSGYLQDEVLGVAVDTQQKGFPPPLHVFDQFDLECARPRTIADAFSGTERWAPTDGQRAAAAALARNRDALLALPIPDQSVVMRWWALAAALMSDPRVGDVFRALGRDGSGGSFASDEQVMLAAAPIAVSYGLDVDELARRLWDRSWGWWARPDLWSSRTYSKAVYDCPETHWYDPTSWGPEGCDIVGSNAICRVRAENAAQVQLAVLAKDGFEVAEEMRREGLGRTAIFMAAAVDRVGGSALRHAAVPLALGAVGAGALALAGAGLVAAAAPVGLAVLWLLASWSTKVAGAGSAGGSGARSDASTILARTGRGRGVRVGRLGTAGEFDGAGDRGLCPFDLHHADASRYKCWEELLALEDHVVGDWCPDCASKHVGAAIKFLREARALEDGSEVDVEDARRIVEIRAHLRDSLEELRALRKSIGERIRVRTLLEPEGHQDRDCGCGGDHGAGEHGSDAYHGDVTHG